MRLTTILARVASRTGIALWRQRVGLLVALVAIVGLGAYQIGFAGPTTSTSALSAGVDCADTAMNAVAQIDDEAARAAYQCLGEEMRRSDEQQFVNTLHERGDIPEGRVNRVGEHPMPDGGRIVFYTIEAGGTAVGYIVYLDERGLVAKIE
jgi:hypothetical protein